MLGSLTWRMVRRPQWAGISRSLVWPVLIWSPGRDFGEGHGVAPFLPCRDVRGCVDTFFGRDR